MADIELKNLGFTYPGNPAPTLSELDLRVDDGATHALLGASGAGKTTIMNLLSGLLAPTRGQILIDGRNVSALDARNRNVALVFQFPVLYESKTILENLCFPLENRGWSAAEAKRRAMDIADEIGVSDVLRRRPGGLSLFDKQLAAIAKSLVRTDVDLVLLDEPLTAVEPAIKWRLRQTLTRFQAAHGLTMIYVTHDQTEALTFADQVSVIADGRILQTGSPDDIYNNPADPFIGSFIGSPGMQFLDYEIRGQTQGQIPFPAISGLPRFDVADGHYRLGLRAEWVVPVLATFGRWQVKVVSLLGTRGGEVTSLLTVQSDDGVVMAIGEGDFAAGQQVELTARHAVLFPVRGGASHAA